MARDASLDDFAAGTDDGDEASDDRESNGGGDEASDDRAEATEEEPAEPTEDATAEPAEEPTEDSDGLSIRDPSAVEPAVATSTLASDGEACASCGTSTRRLWTAEGDVVCADCKPW